MRIRERNRGPGWIVKTIAFFLAIGAWQALLAFSLWFLFLAIPVWVFFLVGGHAMYVAESEKNESRLIGAAIALRDTYKLALTVSLTLGCIELLAKGILYS